MYQVQPPNKTKPFPIYGPYSEIPAMPTLPVADIPAFTHISLVILHVLVKIHVQVGQPVVDYPLVSDSAVMHIIPVLHITPVKDTQPVIKTILVTVN